MRIRIILALLTGCAAESVEWDSGSTMPGEGLQAKNVQFECPSMNRVTSYGSSEVSNLQALIVGGSALSMAMAEAESICNADLSSFGCADDCEEASSPAACAITSSGQTSNGGQWVQQCVGGGNIASCHGKLELVFVPNITGAWAKAEGTASIHCTECADPSEY